MLINCKAAVEDNDFNLKKFVKSLFRTMALTEKSL